jgi:hypothetical protein
MANRFGAAAAIPWMRIPQASGGHYGMPDPRVVSGVTLWMDAADSSTITQSANEVSQWNSKVGGRNFSQAGAGLKPLTNTVTKNGLNVLDFDGVDDVMNCSVTNATLYTAAALTVFLVANADTVDATYRGFYGDDSALVIDAQSTDRIRVGHADAGGFDVLSGIPITAGTWFILRARHDGGNIRRAINADGQLESGGVGAGEKRRAAFRRAFKVAAKSNSAFHRATKENDGGVRAGWCICKNDASAGGVARAYHRQGAVIASI